MVSELGLALGLGGVLAVSCCPCPPVAVSPRVPKYRDDWADNSVEDRNLSRNETGGLPA